MILLDKKVYDEVAEELAKEGFWDMVQNKYGKSDSNQYGKQELRQSKSVSKVKNKDTNKK